MGSRAELDGWREARAKSSSGTDWGFLVSTALWGVAVDRVCCMSARSYANTLESIRRDVVPVTTTVAVERACFGGEIKSSIHQSILSTMD
jgi:hypothetical protein